jgi:hypothetical protein
MKRLNEPDSATQKEMQRTAAPDLNRAAMKLVRLIAQSVARELLDAEAPLGDGSKALGIEVINDEAA